MDLLHFRNLDSFGKILSYDFVWKYYFEYKILCVQRFLKIFFIFFHDFLNSSSSNAERTTVCRYLLCKCLTWKFHLLGMHCWKAHKNHSKFAYTKQRHNGPGNWPNYYDCLLKLEQKGRKEKTFSEKVPSICKLSLWMDTWRVKLIVLKKMINKQSSRYENFRKWVSFNWVVFALNV